jgi:7-cyano-7-deazaguanine reductase
MDMNNNIKDWWFSKKIEEFTDEELKNRIKEVMALDTATIIRTMNYVGNREVVEYKTNELIALCPATGYPDFYEISIKYIPNTLLPELKAFKFYLMQFMAIPISHEHLASKIYSDLKNKIYPAEMRIKLITAIRCGITTIVEIGDQL